MKIDIFPAINLPVVMMAYNYPGLSAIDMERRIVLITERACSTTVNGIEHIESESIEGLGLEKIYFQSRHRHRLGHRATDRYLTDGRHLPPARHRAADCFVVQRSQRAGRAAQCLQRHAVGAAAFRRRTKPGSSRGIVKCALERAIPVGLELL
jgi:hypothetical protein